MIAKKVKPFGAGTLKGLIISPIALKGETL